MTVLLMIVALVLIYAAKAASVLRWGEGAVADSPSFSWVRPGMRDETLRAWSGERAHAPAPAAARPPRPASAGRFVPSAIVMPRA